MEFRLASALAPSIRFSYIELCLIAAIHDRSFRATALKRKAAAETHEKLSVDRERFDFQR
ncbi:MULTISPECIES: hypothetical protein [Rhizobium]|uniref:hypothetical protein n=1 Tax=Rhizobium TaxID=379 RepID=UPI0015E16F78|nr:MULTISPECIES: hypothetical protein [Rhizobium]KAF5883540.1 hypothetical protein FY112_19960 [Rhizobium sp. PEPV16]MBY3335217.1 hypothetical protein [Rhizobium laguerreae]MBY5771214.1 hypothetical protein [Rhizobium leguminosarum]